MSPLRKGTRPEVITMKKGYSEFQYRKSTKGDYWEERRQGGSWNRIRVVNGEAEVQRAIDKLASQGYERT
jgi:hypothetical protein